MTNKNYDLCVAYRIYPNISKKPVIYQDNKYNLSELSLLSFKKSLGRLKTKLFVLLDNCPIQYEQLFQKYFSNQDLEIVKLDGIGNIGTFNMQIDVLLDQNYSQTIYLAEDDYFYFPNQFKLMCDFFKYYKDVHFISPYDHPDYYQLNIHKNYSEIRTFEKKHWRTGNSTCLTFLTTKEVLEKTEKIFRSYTKGNFDSSIWMSLTKSNLKNIFKIPYFIRKDPIYISSITKAWFFCWQQILFGKRWKLWVPIPTIATHLESSGLSPTIDWSTIFDNMRKKL